MDKKKKGTFSWKGSYITINKKPFLLLILTIVCFFAFIIRNSNREETLMKNGIHSKAVISKIRSVGGKGIIRCFYNFSVMGVQFEGFVDNDEYTVGESIVILYKETDPSFNRDSLYLKKHY